MREEVRRLLTGLSSKGKGTFGSSPTSNKYHDHSSSLVTTMPPPLLGAVRSSPIVLDDEQVGEHQQEVVVGSPVAVAARRSSARLLSKVRLNYCLTKHRSPASPDGKKNAGGYREDGQHRPAAAVKNGKKNKGGDSEDGRHRPAKKAAAAPSPAREASNGDTREESEGEVNAFSIRDVAVISKLKEDMSAYARVKETLRIFNTLYLHFVQKEEQRCKNNGINGKPQKKTADGKLTKQSSRRPDLKAATEMQERKLVLYPKTIGNLEGIDVGYQFYSRAEMVVLGFHGHWLNGIDYIGKTEQSNLDCKSTDLPIAVSIVMSGQYEDDVDNLEDVVYTGQGGNNLLGNKQQIRDQVLERGNLALKNNIEQKIPVRVTRGHASKNSYVGKVYTYDGLYEVVKHWAEKGLSGYTVFKYRLRRLLDQPLLTTNQVYFSRTQVPRSTKDVHGLVCEDISGGLECLPIPATNIVDTPPLPPSGYIYCNTLQIKKNVSLPPLASGCKCKGSCVNTKECACARLNGSDFPYVRQGGGRLVEAKAVIFECGPACGCGPDCVNRTSQRGLRYQFEVFRTPNRGWGVRSWDHIPPGAPICEYKGVLMRTDELDTVVQDTFVFEIDCLQTMKGLDGRESRRGSISANAHAYLESSEDKITESVPEFCIDAGPVGNVSRFINHSCQPNLFVQCVLSSHHDIKQARIVLFASEHIPPLQELTYDYGYAVDSVIGPDGRIKKMPCFCGAMDCRKRLY